MKSKRLRSLYRLIAMIGFDPLRILRQVRSLPGYRRDLKTLREQQRHSNQIFIFGMAMPCLEDKGSESGAARGHYFHQDLLVARRIFLNGATLHADVGSRIDGFVAHVATFRSIVVFDIRPQNSQVANIVFNQADFMKPLPGSLYGYCDSLSCLHALEHFGLGRYGDPIDYVGYLVGLENLYLLLKKGGRLYFSVPIGPQRIEFNAHRVFGMQYLVQLLSAKFEIDRFSFVDDGGNLVEDVALEEGRIKDNFGCSLGCGIFELTKI